MLRLVAAAVLVILAGGCTTVRITPTQRSSVEQRLLVRSLERAAAQLDQAPLAGRLVRLELFSLTNDQLFAREFLRARLESRGVRFAAAGEPADVTLQVFTTALAVDTSDTLIGLPALQAPVLAIPVPEIAVFKWERSRGRAEVQLYAYDAAGRLLGRLPDALGEAKYDRITILLFVTFPVTDIDDPPAPSP